MLKYLSYQIPIKMAAFTTLLLLFFFHLLFGTKHPLYIHLNVIRMLDFQIHKNSTIMNDEWFKKKMCCHQQTQFTIPLYISILFVPSLCENWQCIICGCTLTLSVISPLVDPTCSSMCLLLLNLPRLFLHQIKHQFVWSRA